MCVHVHVKIRTHQPSTTVISRPVEQRELQLEWSHGGLTLRD